MNINDSMLAFVYVCTWGADGFIFARIARQFHREEKRHWPNGKFGYTIGWALSMTWLIGSAFVLGELDRLGDFDHVELLGPFAMIVAMVASLYHYRPHFGSVEVDVRR